MAQIEMDEKEKRELKEQEETIADATMIEDIEGELNLDMTADEE